MSEHGHYDLPVVCIIGRTNVGKSTLFNAIAGGRRAVVKDQPGVTRDRCYEVVNRHQFPFTLIDTGALVGEESIPLHESVREQTELAIKQSDLLLVVFDGLHGLHPLDSEVLGLVREMGKPTLFVANKCEKPSAQLTSTELYGLGVDEIIPVSAAHRRGIRHLISRIFEELPEQRLPRVETVSDVSVIGLADGGDPHSPAEGSEIPEHSTDQVEQPAVKVAVVGKPNVGKSTFVNSLLGEERMVTSPIAGTTRDSIHSELERNGGRYELVDTAGLRKKASVRTETVERYSNIRTLRSLAQCDVAVFLLDAAEGIPTEQDAKIIGLAHEKGKSIVIVVNKWDLIEKDSKMAEAYRRAIRREFKFAAYAPVIFISAKTGLRCFSVLDTVKSIFHGAQQRLSTSEVNTLFSQAFNQKPPPVHRGAPVKLLYATQVATRPPTFAVFVNYPERLRFNYERYLKNCVRRRIDYTGVDVRILFRRRSGVTNKRRKVSM